MKKLIIFFNVFLLIVCLSGGALAKAAAESNLIALETIWTLFAAILVFFMQAGFAMLEAGLIRSKNVGNIIMKNIMDFSLGTLVYWAFGFALMFGSGNGFIGWGGFFLEGDLSYLRLEIPLEAFWFYQAAFAVAAATVVSGAMAERTRYSSYLVYSFVITGIIYPVAGHWVSGGWLTGVVEFSEPAIVHLVGGWAALAGAMVLGPRLGKYNEDGSSNVFPGHDLMMATFGVFILWFGWFGLEHASIIEFGLGVADVVMKIVLAGSIGAISAMITSWIKYGKADVSMTLNGVLAGLTGIAAGVEVITNLGVVFISVVCGVVVVLAIRIIDSLCIDDPVGSVAVHGVCGSLGAILVGVFAIEEGLWYGGGFHLLLMQVLGVVSIMVWSFGIGFILFMIINEIIGLRAASWEERRGLDITEHQSVSYPEFLFLNWKKVKIDDVDGNVD